MSEPTDEPKRVPAHEKPHYWIYKQGKDFWNRWTREGFNDEKLEKISALISSAKYNTEEEKQKRINNWQAFINLEPLTPQEKAKALKNFQKEYGKSTDFPTFSVDFSYTDWDNEKDFSGFVFPVCTNFSFAKFGNGVNFYSATFDELADFTSATFGSSVLFTFTTFSNVADFTSATFGFWVRFTSAIFGVFAIFKSARFGSAAIFTSTTFGGRADFTSTTFSNGADFCSTTFDYGTDFISTTFGDNANFYSATFGNNTLFTSAKFGEFACFISTTFGDNTDFTKAIFSNTEKRNGVTMFEHSNFKDINFSEAKFDGDSSFRHAKFTQDADFSDAVFTKVPKFAGCEVDGVLKFTNAKWPELASHAKNYDKNSKYFANLSIDYSQIKRKMEEIKLHNYELFFHGKELEAKIYDKTTPSLTRLAFLTRLDYRFYRFTSNFGQSIIRPFFGLLLCIVFFTICYLSIFAKDYSNVCDNNLGCELASNWVENDSFTKAFYAVLHNSVPLIPNDSAISKIILGLKEGKDTDFNLMAYSSIRFLNVLFSTIFLFLIGLGIRNRFRMR